MDELDVFRGFRLGVAAPTPLAERRASARLEKAIERRARRGPGVLGALAFVAVAGTAATAPGAPSSGEPARTASPEELERLRQALAEVDD